MLENLDLVLLVMDETVDGGYVGFPLIVYLLLFLWDSHTSWSCRRAVILL